MNSLLSNVVSLAKQAGKQILSIYHSDFTVEYKADKSPVTAADMAAHQTISQGLKQLTPEIPILSEELTTTDFAERQHWQRYWLIDPLDGTKEFLEKNGEFTINIALIENHVPTLGVVYAPAFDFCYFAGADQGAFKQIAAQEAELLQTAAWKKDSPLIITVSRRHGADSLQNFFAQFPALSLIRCGSALKFCWLAEGFADVYPRFSPTSEWDTAAGQCILKEAGGTLIDSQGRILRYNTKPSLRNAAFLAVGDKSHSWANYFV
ncbi:3'(2'),5'-bisphosphate nucleotidase CysQ [Rickettsiella endosymbiont of Dermanyssus gallinae]|uniref:3'(2'),5'-bisphosphate nucleotidase CysQ n=1 Tax=Rickettsiella endosymbiont of Dermanyssus gallinae TaxID=2856608 RepID=UPI001C533A2E|nr:3'(2'),5'-bisphosphate nucleotidase CysQ [Rickettsiella endosymbiont of Dermanyssus gallinae]